MEFSHLLVDDVEKHTFLPAHALEKSSPNMPKKFPNNLSSLKPE